ncbi:MAG: hypothetical protein WB868_19900 [Xanthobacteraceae bacterium]
MKAIRDCATKNRDDLDAGEQQCLFRLVADPCIGLPGGRGDGPTAQCYQIEAAIWGKLRNDNYQALLGELDDEQAGKPRDAARLAGLSRYDLHVLPRQNSGLDGLSDAGGVHRP